MWLPQTAACLEQGWSELWDTKPTRWAEGGDKAFQSCGASDYSLLSHHTSNIHMQAWKSCQFHHSSTSQQPQRGRSNSCPNERVSVRSTDMGTWLLWQLLRVKTNRKKATGKIRGRDIRKQDGERWHWNLTMAETIQPNTAVKLTACRTEGHLTEHVLSQVWKAARVCRPLPPSPALHSKLQPSSPISALIDITVFAAENGISLKHFSFPKRSLSVWWDKYVFSAFSPIGEHTPSRWK